MPWRAVIAGVAALVVGAALALSIMPLGVYDALVCAVTGAGCETREPPELPESAKTRLTPEEVAVRGTYVALGDSFSSGEGAFDERADGTFTDGAVGCHRSRGSYFAQVEAAFPFKRGGAFWACSGATTRNVLSRGMHGETAQVNRVNERTSLVTISVGGNDIGYTEILKTCIIKLPWSSACTDQETKIRGRIGAMQSGLRRVITATARRAPDARILVVGYPRPFPSEPARSLDNIAVNDQKWLNQMARELNNALGAVARTADQRVARAGARGTVEFIDAHDAFDGHEAGTADPYMYGVGLDLKKVTVTGETYHPTRQGYRRLGELVRRQIEKGPGRPINQFRTRGLLQEL